MKLNNESGVERIAQSPPLLVTTAIDASWGEQESIVFLGEWCRPYDRRHAWEGRDYVVTPCHWGDRKKMRTDYVYLELLRNRILDDLVLVLNRIHGKEQTKRYWQTILDPWLLTYISVVWDRWENLREVFQRYKQLKTVSLATKASDRRTSHYYDFTHKVLGDSWNHSLCLDIINSAYRERCQILVGGSRCTLESVAGVSSQNFLAPRSVQYRLLKFADRILGHIFPASKTVIFDGYFSLKALFRLSLKVRQAPRLYLAEFEWPVPLAWETAGSVRIERDDLALTLIAQNAFEAFLFKRIFVDFPSAYLEEFDALAKLAKQIRMKPKLVLTANAHWGNDLFKHWCAEQFSVGTKLVAMEHGGSFVPAFSAMHFEESIADLKTTWAIPCHEKHVQLPSNKLAEMKIYSTRRYLSVVGYETPRYSFRVEACPKVGQMQIQYEMSCAMYAALTVSIQACFRVKPYPSSGWNSAQRYLDTLGQDKVYLRGRFCDFLAEARIVVCTYPQTTFSEAMISGVPSILYFPQDLWEIDPQMLPLLKQMRLARIVFHDPIAAASHVNAIWDAPDVWWESSDVVSARERFLREALATGKDWLNEWAAFINKESA